MPTECQRSLCAPCLHLCSWVAALRLYARLVQEEGRLCAAVFPPGEQAAVLSQVCGLEGCEALQASILRSIH